MVTTRRGNKRKKEGQDDDNTTPSTSKRKKKDTPQSSGRGEEKADSEAGSEPNSSPIITIGPGDKILFQPYLQDNRVEATIISIAEPCQHDGQLDIMTTQGIFDRSISDTLVLVQSNYTPNIPQGGLPLSFSQDNISLKMGNHQVDGDANDKRRSARVRSLAAVATGHFPPLPKNAAKGYMTPSEKRAEEEFDRLEERGSDALAETKRYIEEVFNTRSPQMTNSDDEEDSTTTALPIVPDGGPNVTMNRPSVGDTTK